LTTALLLVAHGSPDPRAAIAVSQLAADVAARHDGPVLTGFLDHDEPRLDAALLTASGLADEVLVVPLLLSQGFHSKVDVPASVALAAATSPQTRFLTAPPLGPHPLLTSALRSRLDAVGVSSSDGTWGVVVAGVGSSEPAGADDVGSAAALLAVEGEWRVLPGFVTSAQPTVGEAVALLLASGAARVAVAPYVLFPGKFPDAIAATPGVAAVAAPLGAHPDVVQLVLTRAALTAGHPDPAYLEEVLLP
jgi:sirohydrochlorin ferrochelatase